MLLGHHYRGGGRGERENNNNDGYDEISMGTTILAVRYRGGIVTGADTRTSSNGYVANRYATKLTFVLDPMADDYTSSTAVMSTRTGGGGEKRTRRRITVVPSTRSRRRHQRQRRQRQEPRMRRTVASTCAICRTGSASDTQALASVVRCELLSRRLLHDVRGTVTHAASLLRTLLLRDDDNDNDDSSMSASLICTGYDHALRRGIIYTISKGGLLFEEQYYGCMGSGSTYIIGHLDSYYNNRRRRHHRDDRDCLRQQQRLGAALAASAAAAAAAATANNNDTIKDTTNAVYNDDDDDNDDDNSLLLPSEQEAIELVYTSIQLAMERDGSSGGFIRIYVIDKFGKRVVVTRMMRNNDDDDDDGLMNDSHVVIEVTDDDDERRRQVGGVTLKDFAPAISPLDF